MSDKNMSQQALIQAKHNLIREGGEVSVGSFLIEQERQRQINIKGWTNEQDDSYVENELLQAAVCYMAVSLDKELDIEDIQSVNETWPWGNADETFNPSTKLRNLAKAGALIAAEMDRIIRKENNEISEYRNSNGSNIPLECRFS